MKKFLLVVLIGMVLALYIYGVVTNLMAEKEEQINHIEETTTMVYVE